MGPILPYRQRQDIVNFGIDERLHQFFAENVINPEQHLAF